MFYKPIIIIYLIILVIVPDFINAQGKSRPADTSLSRKYNQTLNKLEDYLLADGPFKLAVIEMEEVYCNGSLDTTEFNNSIAHLVRLVKLLTATRQPMKYYRKDSNNYVLNYSILSIIHDSVYIKTTDSTFYYHMPFSYNFSDILGKEDWSNMFVSTLLQTGKGNCHSLAYLYKILADETSAKCWLALAPSHIYVRNYSQQIGWYNTELTSGSFPTDAWIATTGYISADAIRSGIYMDTLSNQQSIALCVLDLAKGYEFQTHNYYDGFILKCCDLVLKYHPVNPMALLLKAETLKKVYLKQTQEKGNAAASTYAEMEKAYITLAKLHYREMPEKMYQQWLSSLTKGKEKYINKKIQPRTK